jgi:hypothetical protein
MPEATLPAQFLAAFELPPEKKIYFNGFAIALSPMDCTIALLLNNQPIALLNASHTTVKTLISQLDGLINDFEGKTKQPILKLDEIQVLVEKHTE